MLFLIMLAVGLLSLLGSRRFYGDYATPIGVYTLAWFLLIGLFKTNVVSYDPVPQTTWLAIYLSFGCFTLGSWTVLAFGQLLLARGESHGAFEPFAVAHLSREKMERLLYGLFVLGLIGFLMQLQHLQQTIGWSTFFSNPVLARELHSNVKYWGYLNILNVPVLVLVAIHFANFRRVRPFFLPIILLALASALVTTDRTRFFYMVLWSLFAVLHCSGGVRLTRRHLLGLSAATLVLFLFFVLVGNFYERKYSDRFSEHIHFQGSAKVLAEPYIYLTGSIPALSALMADKNPMYMGKFSFSPLVKLFSLIDPTVETVPLQGELYNVPMELNTYSYLQQFYLDWGWWGIILGPYVCGFLACWLYLRMRRKRDFLSIYLSSLVTYCCVISIFVNMFTQEATWFFALVGLAVSYHFGKSKTCGDGHRQ